MLPIQARCPPPPFPEAVAASPGRVTGEDTQPTLPPDYGPAVGPAG